MGESQRFPAIRSVYAACGTSCRSEHAEDFPDLFFAVESAERTAEQSHVRGCRRRPCQIDVQALVQERLPHRRAGLEVGHNHCDYRRLRRVGAEREAELSKAGM